MKRLSTPVKRLVAGKSLYLSEVINGNNYHSLVDFAPNGSMVFTDFSEDLKNVRGTWSEGRNRVLKMVIERTYIGKSSEYTIKSNYIGVTDIEDEEENHNGFRNKNNLNALYIGGEVSNDDEDCETYNMDVAEFILATPIENLRRIKVFNDMHATV